MPLIVKLMYVFAIGAIGGWCLELVYRSIRAKRLFNPGFLTGPSLPIYGFGNVILYFVTKIDLSFCGAKWVQVTAMFLLIAIAMTLLELVTGYLFYHFMQLRLWDYTKRWGNYKGFICPLFTVFWGALGIAFYLFAQPLLTWFLKNAEGSVFWIVMISIYYTLLCVDIFYSFKLGIKIKNFFIKVSDTVAVNLQEIKEKFYRNEKKEHRFVFFTILFRINSYIKKKIKEAALKREKKNDDGVDGKLKIEESGSEEVS